MIDGGMSHDELLHAAMGGYILYDCATPYGVDVRVLSPDGAGGVRTVHQVAVSGVDLDETSDRDWVNSPGSGVPENARAVRPHNDSEVARAIEDLRIAESVPDLVRGSNAAQARTASLRNVIHAYWEWYSGWGLWPPTDLYSPGTEDARVVDAFERHKAAVRSVLHDDGALPRKYRGHGGKSRLCNALADFESDEFNVRVEPESIQTYLKKHVWMDRTDWEKALEEWAAPGRTGV